MNEGCDEDFSRSSLPSSPSHIPSALSTPSSDGGTLAACFSWLLRETPSLSFATSDSMAVSTKHSVLSRRSSGVGQEEHQHQQQQARLKRLLSSHHSLSKKSRRAVAGVTVKSIRKKRASSSLSVVSRRYRQSAPLLAGGSKCRLKFKRLLFTRKPQRRD